MVLVRKRRGGRRHKKLKAIDPFYSGPRKLLVDKKLVGANQAPKKAEQISHRFQEFLDNKKQAEESSKKKSKNKFKQTSSEHPELEQKSNESDRNYLQRLNQEVKFAVDRARYESKYDVKLINTNKDNHQFEVKKEKSQRSEKRLKRLQAKKAENKLKKEEKKDDFQLLFQDKPKFGETVHEPPILTLPKRAKVKQFATTAGMKDLLLKEKINQWNK